MEPAVLGHCAVLLFALLLHRRGKNVCLEHFCCLFLILLSAYLPDFSHKCIFKQYYINHSITCWTCSRLSPEWPHVYWITNLWLRSAVLMCQWKHKGLIGAGNSAKGLQALPGIVYYSKYTGVAAIGKCNVELRLLVFSVKEMSANRVVDCVLTQSGSQDRDTKLLHFVHWKGTIEGTLIRYQWGTQETLSVAFFCLSNSIFKGVVIFKSLMHPFNSKWILEQYCICSLLSQLEATVVCVIKIHQEWLFELAQNQLSNWI